MFRRIATLLGVVLVVAGCSIVHPKPPSGFVNGTSIHTIKLARHDRNYRLHKPAGVLGSARLVIMLHGGFGSAEQAERSYGWDQLADSEKFVVAYPDGLNRAWNVDGGGCCGRPAHENVDDVAFISATIADIAKNVGIDVSRVYATGMSNGAMMSYTLACDTTLFAAIGPVSGTQAVACRTPHPISVMAVHGTADPLVPYGGGPGRGFSRINGPPTPELNAFWRNVDHCQPPTAATDDLVTTSTAGCADNRGVVLVTVADGGHRWPDFASKRLWEFFSAHPR
jgi:polyhydroxybutyrate depolymerase